MTNRLPGDVKYNKLTGDVRPGGGASIDLNPASAGKYGPLHIVDLDSIPDGLQIVQQGIRETHHIIQPAIEMPYDVFKRLLESIKLIPYK